MPSLYSWKIFFLFIQTSKRSKHLSCFHPLICFTQLNTVIQFLSIPHFQSSTFWDHPLSYLLLPISLWSRHCYNHFTKEKIQTLLICPSHKVLKWQKQNWNANLHNLAPSPFPLFLVFISLWILHTDPPALYENRI